MKICDKMRLGEGDEIMASKPIYQIYAELQEYEPKILDCKPDDMIVFWSGYRCFLPMTRVVSSSTTYHRNSHTECST